MPCAHQVHILILCWYNKYDYYKYKIEYNSSNSRNLWNIINKFDNKEFHQVTFIKDGSENIRNDKKQIVNEFNSRFAVTGQKFFNETKHDLYTT